ncbi:MAG TPA: histidine phosphatase family protein [Thermomicrobiales bacterium]|nr:histidine phosphatase family protein [Thermomicrobiales bacterium]
MSIDTELRTFSRLRHAQSVSTHLYLVRHGQTAGNVSHQLIGHTDMPLDDLGERQASQVGMHMRSIRLDAVIASPLMRARVTATEIARYQGHELLLEPRLREMNFGHAEGYTMVEAAERFPELMVLRDDPLNETFAWPGGDRRRDFHTRIFTTFEEIALRNTGRHVAVVCHGGVIGSLIAQLDGGSPNDFAGYPVANCSVTHLEVRSSETIAHRINDIAHLDVVRTEPWSITIPDENEQPR